jgi:hypothetical protein
MASATEQAVRRLEAALRSLELAIEERMSRAGRTDPEEVTMLNADRARLAEELDGAEARAARLENVNREVSRRLGAAVETIRSVLDRQEEGG